MHRTLLLRAAFSLILSFVVPGVLRSQETPAEPMPQPAIESETKAAATPSTPVETQHSLTPQPSRLRQGSISTTAEHHPYFRGWLFRRYAGTYEMETKTPYPPTYHGTYTYRPWQPDWTRPPMYYLPPPPNIIVEELPAPAP